MPSCRDRRDRRVERRFRNRGRTREEPSRWRPATAPEVELLQYQNGSRTARHEDVSVTMIYTPRLGQGPQGLAQSG